MIFNILSVTIASVLGCLQRAPTCGGPSLAFTCLCAGAAVPGSPEHGLPKGSAADPAPVDGPEGSGILVPGAQSVPGKRFLT